MAEQGATPIEAGAAASGPDDRNQSGSISVDRRYPPVSTDAESFFLEPVDPRQEAMAMASEVVRRLLIWMADGRSLEERGLRASVALYCIRPDLIDGATLEQIGAQAGRSRQMVHKLANAFRETTGLQR